MGVGHAVSFYGRLFAASLGQRVRRAGVWCLLLATVATVWAARTVLSQTAGTPFTVALAAPEEGSGELTNRLLRHGGELFTFRRMEEAEARAQVVLGEADCALIFPEDWADRVARGDTRELVLVVTGPGSMMDAMVREAAALTLLEYEVPRIAETYLQSKGLNAEPDYAGSAPETGVTVAVETAGGQALSVPEMKERELHTWMRLALWAVAALWAALTAWDVLRWGREPFTRRLTCLRPRWAVLGIRLLADLTPGAVCLVCLAAVL